MVNHKCYLSLITIVVILSCCTAKPPMVIKPLNPNDPKVLPSNVTRNVLIIGGGLAGLSAAIELADRGYDVTIKEKYEIIGGKLFTRPVNILDKTFQVEHGFHAWFHNYFQFKDIRDRLNINDNFKKWDKVNYFFKNYKPEVIYSSGPYPLNLLGIIERSPNLKLTDAIKSALSLPDMVFFNYDNVYERLDNITFQDWATEKKVAQDFYDIIMAPALSVTLNAREIFSAAEMLNLMQLYFLSEPDADGRETAKSSFNDAVLTPWYNYLIKQNVKILLNRTVNSLKVDSSTLNVYGTIDNIPDDNRYDYVIITADVGSTQNMFEQTLKNYKNDSKISQVLNKIIVNSISKMKIAPDYKVVRIWFDKQLTPDIPDIIETPDFGPINLVVQYSLIENEYIAWANQTGGSVIEFHCYTWSKFFDPNVDDSKVWSMIAPTVKLILPQLFDRKFDVLAYHINSFQNFASFEKGLAAFRPTVSYLAMNSLNNAYLAGDWIRTPYPAALMEKAVSTGREAANEILLKDHVCQSTLTVTNKHGPGI